MSLRNIRDSFTQIIAMQLHANNRSHEGITPPDSLTDGWERAYLGAPVENLPPYCVELNHFKNDVDFCVSLLMAELCKKKDEETEKLKRLFEFADEELHGDYNWEILKRALNFPSKDS